MTAPHWRLHQGDATRKIQARCNGVDSLSPVSTITGILTKTGQDDATIDGVVLDAAALTVELDTTEWLATAATGVWQLKIRCADSDADPRWTWPEEGRADIEVIL